MTVLLSKNNSNNSLILKVASPEQSKQTILNNYIEWGAPQLTLDQYILREDILSKEAFAGVNRSCWVLVSEENSLDILAACETYKRPCWMITTTINNCSSTFNTTGSTNDIKNTSINESEESENTSSSFSNETSLKEGFVYSVASVFTQKKHRGNGYATTMMIKLAEKFQKLVPDCLGTTLYSDIGPYFYTRLGWKLYLSEAFEISEDDLSNLFMIHNSSYASYPLLSPPDLDFQSSAKSLHVLKNLLPEDLESIVDLDQKITKARMLHPFHSSSSYISQSNQFFYVVTTKESIDWMIRRATVYAKIMSKTMKYVGVSFNRSFMLWYHNFKENSLDVIRFNCDAINPNDIQMTLSRLFKAALEECQVSSLGKIHIWNPSEHVKPYLPQNGTLAPREDSLSSLHLFNEDTKNEEENSVQNNSSLVEWINNEHYAWV